MKLPAFATSDASAGEPVDVDQAGIIGQVDPVVLFVDGIPKADQRVGCDDQQGILADSGLQLLRAAAVVE